jgi:putative ABC transport system substrate-binding protein
VEGDTIVIEWRWGDGTPERARERALELVQLLVDVFVGVAADGPLAAMQATRTLPIVFVGVVELVAMGLVASLARLGGNVTGMTSQVDLAFLTKRLELLREAVPGVTRIAALQHGAFVRAVPVRLDMQHAVEEAARALGMHLQVMEVDLVRQRKRSTYRLLQRQFALEEAPLEDLKAELFFAHPQIADADDLG